MEGLREAIEGLLKGRQGWASSLLIAFEKWGRGGGAPGAPMRFLRKLRVFRVNCEIVNCLFCEL